MCKKEIGVGFAKNIRKRISRFHTNDPSSEQKSVYKVNLIFAKHKGVYYNPTRYTLINNNNVDGSC